MEFEAHHIRQYVDGELSPQDAAALEQSMKSDTELAARIEFERSLRAAVARHGMHCATAPAEVSDRIRVALASCEPQPEEPTVVATISATRETPPRRRSSIFQNPTRINYLALAACLAIISGAILFGIFGDQGWWLRQDSPTYSISTVAEMAVTEHNRCVFDSDIQANKIHVRSPQSIDMLMNLRLGGSVPLFDLSSAGYELVGAGECFLPPTSDETVHVMYRRSSGLLGQVSVFIQPDRGQFDLLEPGVVYRPRDFSSCLETGSSCVFRNGGLVYFLIACDSENHPLVQSLVMTQIADGSSSP